MLTLSFAGAVNAAAAVATINLSQVPATSNSQGIEGPVYDPVNNYVYAHYGSNETAVISGSSLIANISTGGVYYFVVDPSNGYLYGAAGGNFSYALVISGTSIIANVTVGTRPAGSACPISTGVAYDPFNGYVYVDSATCYTPTVGVINGTSLIANVSGGGGDANDIPVVDTANGDVYVGNGGNPATLTVISGTAAVGAVTVGTANQGIESITFDPSNGYMYVVCDTSLWVLSGTTIVATIPFNDGIGLPQVDSSNGDVYVASSQTSQVSTHSSVAVISGTTVLANITVADLPAITLDSVNGYLYVSSASFGTNNITIISGTKIIGNVSVSQYMWLPVVDPSNGEVFVTSAQPAASNPGEIWIISGLSLAGTVTAGANPGNPLYNPSNGYFYVPNQGVASISVISPSASGATSSSSSSVSTATSSQAPTTTSQAASTTSTSSSGSGVPAFPYQLGIAAVFTLFLVASYLLMRRRVTLRRIAR